MSYTHRVVSLAIKSCTRLLCRIETAPLVQVPAQGPLILVTNHINFIDAPVMYTHLQPRPVTALAKSETWDSPWLGPLFTLWGVIPLRRGEADTTAFRLALQALKQGKILAVAPEGTRSGNGRLLPGYPGIVALALRSGAPLLPAVFFGQERLKDNLRRLRRTDFNIKIGPPFCLRAPTSRLTHTQRQAITDEIMYQLAMLLPAWYRGAYADLSAATTHYIEFRT